MGLTIDPFVQDPDDWPPLWAALLARDLLTVRQLLREGAKLDDVIEPDGNTFLHRAAAKDDVELVEFLLARGCPQSIESFDYVDKTPLIWAAENGHLEIILSLLEAGANPNAHREEMAGDTAIKRAVGGGHVEIVSALLAAGADPTIPGWMQVSAVDKAHCDVAGGLNSKKAERIRHLLRDFPSNVRDRQNR